MTNLQIPVEHGARVTVLSDRCAGCQECVVRCPVGALSMDPSTWTVLAQDATCVGCRQCERTCPFGAISVDGEAKVTARHDPPLVSPVTLRDNLVETRPGYSSWADVLAEASRCLSCPDPTCVRGCPAHNDIPGFIAALRDGDLAAAHEIISRTSVLPDVCSRVCNQAAQCEGACTWSLAGAAPVAIGRLERWVADQMTTPGPRRDDEGPGAGLTVGIIGAGPAAAGAAWDLVEAGASVTVYEKDGAPGGLCGWGMPEFTLPESVAMRAWDQLRDAGVQLRLEHTVNPEDLEGLLGAHDAVIAAQGAGTGVRPHVPGLDLEGVVDATTFLKGAKVAFERPEGVASFLGDLGLSLRPGAHVLVLGAGNTAMDVARLARRLGLEVTCVDWLDERFALARPDELAEARHEGVDVRFLRTLTEVRGEGRVERAVLAITTQRDAAASPSVTSGREELAVDLVVTAMGYRVDAAFTSVLPGLPVRKVAEGIVSRRWTASGVMSHVASTGAHRASVGTLALNREVALDVAAQPVSPRLWAVGDALTGPSTVVEAMAQGRRAARAIIDAGPRRPGREADPTRPASRVLVCYASEGGRTAALAARVGVTLADRGVRVTLKAVGEVGPMDVAHADALVVGSWVEGLVLARVRPAPAMREWVSSVVRLGGRPVGVFCTYAVNPRSALTQMRTDLEARGADVVAEAAVGRRASDVDAVVDAFVDSLMTTLVHH
ncbi:MAG: FAD-dependent oxidoreductase [Acidobacteria bacterium]|nr:FAD-dependent oxidoreductase [Acidobacteriota bacterium]